MGGLSLLLSGLLGAGALAAEDGPNQQGLQLWLDAADTATVVTDASGAVVEWKDKSGHERHAHRGDEKCKATLVQGAMNGKPVVRFTGSERFSVPAIKKAKGPVTVFAVWQRSEAQASDHKWQRLVSSWDGAAADDRKPPCFCFTAGDKTGPGGGGACAAVVQDESFADVQLSAVCIGASAKSGGSRFTGDIAEILIYDRGFVTEDAIQSVLDYLGAKWGARLAREVKGWTRTGELGATPKRVTGQYPLSDQENKGGWVRYEPMSDEFEGAVFDEGKWYRKHSKWLGRQPALFSAENVEQSGGQMRLTMRKQQTPDMEKFRNKGYHDYTSASVESKDETAYGYFEVMAKPMKSAGSSSFWFSGTTEDAKGVHRTEIDVFEIGGAAPGFERKYNMNLHVFQTPEEKRHWNVGGRWIAPWDLADDFHVYGLEWGEKEIQYYVDGVVVRKVNNTDWHYPLHMIFDSETMPDWLGMPRDEDLPSTYCVEYVRAWKKARRQPAPAGRGDPSYGALLTILTIHAIGIDIVLGIPPNIG